MFAENLFSTSLPHSLPMHVNDCERPGRENLVYNNSPLHYIIHNSKAHKFLLSGKKKRKILTEARRKKICGYGFSPARLSTKNFSLMARWWRKGKRRKGKKSNQNCM
jgi:hypothetical protein